jgi:RNA polymerase sigma factor (sigma-70 family)
VDFRNLLRDPASNNNRVARNTCAVRALSPRRHGDNPLPNKPMPDSPQDVSQRTTVRRDAMRPSRHDSAATRGPLRQPLRTDLTPPLRTDAAPAQLPNREETCFPQRFLIFDPRCETQGLGMETQNGIFKVTRWTTVLQAGQIESPDSHHALARLCEDYRPPLLIFARNWLRSPEDAEDLTQSFLCHFVARNLPGSAGRDRGRFRTFLLACFKNFLRDELRRKRRAKVIPTELLAPIATEDDEAGGVDPAVAPAMDRQLDALWAESIRMRVVRQLEQSYQERGKAQLFAELRCLLEGQKPALSYAQLAAMLNISEPLINVEVMRLRERFRKAFRAEIRQTVTNEGELDEEFRYLLSLLFSTESR